MTFKTENYIMNRANPSDFNKLTFERLNLYRFFDPA